MSYAATHDRRTPHNKHRTGGSEIGTPQDSKIKLSRKGTKRMSKVNWKQQLMTPDNSVVVFIDHQPQMTFGVTSINHQVLINNVEMLAKAARTFKVPTILTAVETESFSGYLWPQLLDIFPGQDVIERSSMNAWDDPHFVEAVKKTGRKKLILAALWSEVCLAMPAIEALAEGYEVYAVEDASGGTSLTAHNAAFRRIEQAGAVPVTALQVLLEYQRDWSRQDTYNDVIATVKEHAGGYGVGVEYAYTMVHKQPQSAGKPHVVVTRGKAASH
jgi:nicotinamidase-related amidase